MTPCASNYDLSNKSNKTDLPQCATSSTDCVITDMQIIEENSSELATTFADYTKKISSSDASVATKFYVAFTTGTNTRSNAPLQSIKMTYGTPCAFSA